MPKTESHRILFYFSGLFLALIQSCGDKIELVTPPKSGDPGEKAKQVEMLYTDSALVKAKLKSPVVHRFSDSTERIVFPEGIHLDFYNEEGKIISWMTSEYALRFEKEKKMEARKNVVVVNEKGEKLNTEHLVWDQDKKIIYTEAPVKITTKHSVDFGDGLTASEDFSTYKIKNFKGSRSINDHE